MAAGGAAAAGATGVAAGGATAVARGCGGGGAGVAASTTCTGASRAIEAPTSRAAAPPVVRQRSHLEEAGKQIDLHFAYILISRHNPPSSLG